MNRDPLSLLESSRSMSILLFIREHEGCRKMELYDAVCGDGRMPKKLDNLEAAGLIAQKRSGMSTFLSLTDKGRRVADVLEEIQRIMEE